MAVTKLRPHEPECEITGRDYVLVPPGRYELQFHYHETFLAFHGAAKVVLWFEILDFGEFFKKPLPKFYNAEALKSKPRRGGAFKAGRRSNLVFDLCSLFPDAIGRLDRVSLSPFRRGRVVGEVETVSVASGQRELPAPLRYSVIRKLERFKP